eukprot:31100-Pelagococcus_subviridis.AAC.1
MNPAGVPPRSGYAETRGPPHTKSSSTVHRGELGSVQPSSQPAKTVASPRVPHSEHPAFGLSSVAHR